MQACPTDRTTAQALLAIVLLAAGGLTASNAPAGTTYRVTNLGYLVDPEERSPFTRGWRVNAQGHVAGETAHPESGITPFLWTAAVGMQSLGPPLNVAPLETWIAIDLNDTDEVVGYARGTATPGAFLWTPAEGLRDLEEVIGAAGIESVGGINAAGDIVGMLTEAGATKPFVWREGQGLQILTPPFPIASAERNNAAGQFIGSSSGSPAQAYRWDPQTGFHLLGDLPGGLDSSAVYGQNQAGHVVGASSAAVGGSRAYLWTAAGGMEDLGMLSDGEPFNYWALGINASDQVVGSGTGSGGSLKAFLWTREEGMRDLNSLIDPVDPLFRTLRLSYAIDINDSGQIIAFGQSAETWNLAFLLTPVTSGGSTPTTTIPLPVWSLAVLALALVGAARAARTRCLRRAAI